LATLLPTLGYYGGKIQDHHKWNPAKKLTKKMKYKVDSNGKQPATVASRVGKVCSNIVQTKSALKVAPVHKRDPKRKDKKRAYATLEVSAASQRAEGKKACAAVADTKHGQPYAKSNTPSAKRAVRLGGSTPLYMALDDIAGIRWSDRIVSNKSSKKP
jgi:hypothetical protein